MSFGLIVIFLVLASSAKKALWVNSAATLANASLDEFDSIHLLKSIVIPTLWKPQNFSGSINGYGNGISILSATGIFDVLTDVAIYNLTIAHKGDGAHTGALAKKAMSVSIIGCDIDLALEYSTFYRLNSASGLLATVSNLVLTGCTIRISITSNADNNLTAVGGLALHCGTLTMAGCSATVQLFVKGAKNTTVGGLTATAGAINVTGSVVTITLTYIGHLNCSIGGLVGMVNKGDATITDLVLNIPHSDVVAWGTTWFGAAIGQSTANVLISNSASYLGQLQFNISNGGIGGLVGAVQENGHVSTIFTNSFIDKMIVRGTGSHTVRYHGCLVALCNGSLSFSQLLLRGKFIMPEAQGSVSLGGLSGEVSSITGHNSVSYLELTGLNASNPYFAIGGFVGAASNSSFVNLVGDVNTHLEIVFGNIGGIVGISSANVTACYARVNILATRTLDDTNMEPLTTGAIIGKANSGGINASYGIANISGLGFSVIGGIVGSCVNTAIEYSFAMMYLDYVFITISRLGGLIGRANHSTVEHCHAVVDMTVAGPENTMVGGFIGTMLDAPIFRNCILYGNLTIQNVESLNPLYAGNFVGWLFTVVPLVNCFSTLYVHNDISLVSVPFVRIGDLLPSSSYACAALGAVTGCTAASDFQSLSYFESRGWKLDGIFDTKDDVMNSYIFLTSVPALDFSTMRFTLLTADGSPWSINSWVVSATGFPHLEVNYSYTCFVSAGCHGSVSQLGTITCSSGWTGNNSHPCSTFRCNSDSECLHGGSCTSGTCTCVPGHSGQDCSLELCGAGGILKNGSCVCNSTAYFINSTGQCELGCTGGCGNGTCTGKYVCICFAGYESIDGHACSKFACDVYEPSCYSMANCIKSTTSDDHICVCAQKTQYFSLTLHFGECIEGCPNIHNGLCVGPERAVCDAGWVNTDKVLCGMYNCTLGDAGSICNNLGKCSNGTCVCNKGTFLVNGTCESGKDKCGPCVNGVCVYNEIRSTFQCQCLPSYKMVDNKCFKDNCGKCSNGLCNPDYATQTLTCHCKPGYIMELGECYKDQCGTCNNGICMINESTNVRTCYCNIGYDLVAETCYLNKCGLCGNGTCTADNHTQRMVCKCNKNYRMYEGVCYIDLCGTCRHGKCTPNAATKELSCSCNSGYTMVGNTCYQNVCGACANGTCTADDASQKVLCSCNTGYKIVNGSCYEDYCGTCGNGTCVADAASKRISCICHADYILFDDKCYRNTCGPCDNGKCIADTSSMILTCICNAEYTKIYDVCYHNTCGACHNGTCVSESSIEAVICLCNTGFLMTNGRCYLDTCGDCENGTCVANDSLLQWSCQCNAGYTMLNSTCYFNNCDLCKDGICVSDSAAKVISCVCEEGSTLLNGVCIQNKNTHLTVIIAPIVIIVVILIIVAIVVPTVLVRRKHFKAVYTTDRFLELESSTSTAAVSRSTLASAASASHLRICERAV